MSSSAGTAVPLEEQVDDVRAVIDAAGAGKPVLMAITEGGALSALFAASHPEKVRALVLLEPIPRMVRGPGYEWAQTVEERNVRIVETTKYWGIASDLNPWSNLVNGNEGVLKLVARYQRLSMSPANAAAAMLLAGDTDVRHVLPNVQCRRSSYTETT